MSSDETNDWKDPLMPNKEVSALVGLSIRTLDRMEQRGDFPKHVKQGLKRFYFESAIKKYLESLRQQRA